MFDAFFILILFVLFYSFSFPLPLALFLNCPHSGNGGLVVKNKSAFPIFYTNRRTHDQTHTHTNHIEGAHHRSTQQNKNQYTLIYKASPIPIYTNFDVPIILAPFFFLLLLFLFIYEGATSNRRNIKFLKKK